jgi:hypothetical protein
MDEIDLKGAMVDGEAAILNHFTKDLDSLAKDYERPTPEWCAELYDVQAQIEALQLREKKLKDVAKKWKDRGSFVHGGYCLKISERAGSRTLDKEALFQRLTAELGEAEAQTYMNEATKVGKPSVVISIEKISQGDTGPGERSGT